ncbi:MAG TPA: serine hydrolase domain-containing protein [Candidatus Cybelea sp.]|jgi:D-alanyl-D-alanine carboxypeptidase|nr:serine hydrolase domain-containing protein [Candidatus Cybelea sp.]
MSRLASIIIGAIIVCLGAPYAAGGASAMPSANSPSVRAAIVAAVEKDRKLYGGRTPVAAVLVGVWDGAGGAYVHGFGYADLAKRRPLTSADHFRIGSNTKTFVVAVILQLVDENKLRLDDPLSRFAIGIKVPNARKITVRQLCNMRSGLFEAYESPQVLALHITSDSKFDPHTIIAWAVQQKPYFAPGKGYHYSNTNYLILGLIIEALTHDSVGNEIRKRLLEPFGLTQTRYPDTQAMPDPWAHGYGLDRHGNWEDVSGTIPVSLMGAAGAMISDMADIKRWIELYVTGKVSGPATHRALVNCLPTGDGNLAFGLALGCSAGWYGYTGGLPGYNTADYYFPPSHAMIVAWVAAQRSKPEPGVANAIFRDIARIMTPGNVPFLISASRSGL